MTRAFTAVVVASLIVAARSSSAQDYVTVSWVNLRRTASNTGAKIRVLPPGETLSVRTVEPRSGFVPVRTSDGKAGWIGEATVRDLRAEAEANATTLAGPTDTPAT